MIFLRLKSDLALQHLLLSRTWVKTTEMNKVLTRMVPQKTADNHCKINTTI